MRNWLLLFICALFNVLAVPRVATATTGEKSFACREAFLQARINALALDHAIDTLIGIESELKIAEDTTERLLRDSARNSQLAAERSRRQTELVKIRERYEALSNSLLEDTFDKNNVEKVEALQRELRQITDGVHGPAPVSANKYSDLIKNPGDVQPNVKYEVPQPSSINGQPGVHQMSVTFSDEVATYFAKDATRASRFMRAIQKGFVAPNSGSGIRRIVEFGNLVEVKIVHIDGSQRLLGCRGANGQITILKSFEKHNHNSSADLKHFAHLCD